MNLSNELVLARFEQEFPGVVKATETGIDGMLAIEIDHKQVVEVLRKMRDDSVLQFNFLSSLNGMHFPQNEGRELGVVYHLHNWVKNFRMRVKVFFPIANPHVPSLTAVWPSANWMERQEYDFFGIIFDGHPDLRRILNVDDLDVFPMRKEYKLEDGTRTDKDDRFFGRDGHEGRSFD